MISTRNFIAFTAWGIGLSYAIPSLGNSLSDSTSKVCACVGEDSVRFRTYQYHEALKHAPIFWFADQEEYLPTMPFFPAFDGLDNETDSTGKIDFEDLEEIAPEADDGKNGKYVSWNKLKQWYDELRDSPSTHKDSAITKELATIFFEIDTLDAKILKEMLYSDEQFYRRLDASIKNYIERPGRGRSHIIVVYKYYFYCIQDAGLEGHPQDVERFFIFAPPDESFFVAVGAGHSNFVPNNVLFYRKDDLPPMGRLHVLVELGGHSNAPDLNGNGIFEPGVDANWHIENLWGTRDIQAVAGLGAIGKYAEWMAFERKPESNKRKIFYPPDEAGQALIPRDCYRLVPVDMMKRLDETLKNRQGQGRDREASQKKLKETRAQKSSEKYGLRLQAMVAACNATDKECAESEDTLRRLLNNIVPPFSNSSRGDILTQSFPSQEQLQRLLTWRAGLHIKRDLPPARFYNGFALWTHQEVHSFSARKYALPEWRIAWMFAPRFKPGSKFLDGFVEIHAGVTGPRINLNNDEHRVRLRRWSLSVFYDTYYTRIASSFSLYANFSARFEPGRPDRSHVLGAGVSFVLPYNPPLQPRNFLRMFRLRLGIGYTPFEQTPRVFPQMQLGFHSRSIPVNNDKYVIQATKKHKIWEHADYKKENSTDVFKLHLFRPRHAKGFGIWSNRSRWQHLWPAEELHLSWIVPAKGILPIKIDGIWEIHAGRQRPFHKFTKAKGWTMGVLYDRFYAARLPSWYLSAAWVRSDVSYYSVSGGFSVAIPIDASLKLIHFHLLRARLGLRADVDRETQRLTQHRLELQLGLQH